MERNDFHEKHDRTRKATSGQLPAKLDSRPRLREDDIPARE